VLDNGEYTVIDYPGATSTGLAGINAAGQILGSSGSNGVTNIFVWDKGIFTPILIDIPFGTQPSATAINASGAIVGSYVDPERTTGVEFALRGFLLRF